MPESRIQSARLSRRSFLFLSPLAFGLGGFLQHATADGKLRDELEEQLRRVFHRIRSERQLAPFAVETTLAGIARDYAAEMLRRGFFDHRSPDGEGMPERVARHHRRLIGLPGENLWAGDGVSSSDPPALAERIASDLMGSPGHRENILHADFTHMGVGAEVRRDEVRVVQLLAQVDAYLNSPLPLRLKAGRTADLSLRLVANRGSAARFDLYSLKSRQKEAGPVSIDQPIPEAPSGEYSLRFYFRTDQRRRLSIVYGPSFWLE